MQDSGQGRASEKSRRLLPAGCPRRSPARARAAALTAGVRVVPQIRDPGLAYLLPKSTV